MTRLDIERYMRRQMGMLTDADRDALRENDLRYRQPFPSEVGDTANAYSLGFMTPPGFQAADTVTTAAPATNQANALYLGRPDHDITAVTVRMSVVTALSTTTWAELAICTSVAAGFGAADLMLEGYVGVGATFASAGVQDTEIAVAISRGAHCWLVWGSQAVTPFSVRGGIGDPLLTGRHQFASATRPSTMANPTTFTATSSASVAAWVAFVW